MTVIHILDEGTANKIAAGEVVERPASIVKELVENSIDALSSKIEVEIADGGVCHIRVTDNGTGMSPEDAKLAIVRHATSKIRQVEDLYTVQSLGFRGEALPSIAAVSRFSLTTRQHDVAMGTYVKVSGGMVEDVREAGAGLGTTITVADLFFNTPARKKFLKTLTTESNHIHDIIGKIALSRPEIAFKLNNNGRSTLATPGSGNLIDTIASLYGSQIASELLLIDHSQDGIAVSGFIGKPTVLKSSRQWQTIAVNQRIVSNRMISKALDNAYHSLLPKTGYPLAILHITVAPEAIDVNVHPQKSEVKFGDEQAVFRAVYRSVVNALTSASNPASLSTTIRFPESKAQLSNAQDEQILRTVAQDPNPSYQGNYRQFSSAPLIKGTYSGGNAALFREDSLPLAVARTAMAQQKMLYGIDQSSMEASQDLTLHPMGQVDKCYIIAWSEDGLFIVDQHAAHERILYDRLQQTAGIIPAQQLLVPLLLTIDEIDIQLILEHSAIWSELGFSIDQVGPSLIRVAELPADLSQSDADDMVRDIIIALRNHRQPSPGELRHAILQVASCRAAVKAGDILNMRQMQAILSELCATTLPYTCPHGRPAMIRFSTEGLAKMFKRT